MEDSDEIEKVTLKLGNAANHHSGCKAVRLLTSVGAHTNTDAAYVFANQAVDREVMPRQFGFDMLERSKVWTLAERVNSVQDDGLEVLSRPVFAVVSAVSATTPTSAMRADSEKIPSDIKPVPEVLSNIRLISFILNTATTYTEILASSLKIVKSYKLSVNLV